MGGGRVSQQLITLGWIELGFGFESTTRSMWRPPERSGSPSGKAGGLMNAERWLAQPYVDLDASLAGQSLGNDVGSFAG